MVEEEGAVSFREAQSREKPPQHCLYLTTCSTLYCRLR